MEDTQMIGHKMAIVLLLVLCLMRSVVWGQDDHEGMRVNHTSNTPLPDYSGRIEQDTTWRDTVYVGGDVTIALGTTLTLAPNTKVHFLPYRDDTQGGLDSIRAELIVEGRLHAQAAGIVFGSANAASLGGDWYGIVVEHGGLADVSNATVRDGLRCLYAKKGGRVRMDHIAFANCGKLAKAGRKDSLTVKNMHLPFDIKNGGLRFLAKATVGTLSGLTTTLVAVRALDKIVEPKGDPDADAWRTLGFYLVGAAIGCSVGFPLGVTLIDPYDSFSKTLLAGVIPGVIGMELLRANDGLGFLFLYVGPITSLYASEKWRKPLSAEFKSQFQTRRVSFGLASTFNGGLSAVARLSF